MGIRSIAECSGSADLACLAVSGHFGVRATEFL